MKRTIFVGAIMLIVLSLFSLGGQGVTLVMADGQDTCPQDNGWTKIDSDDLSTYPVDGADAYCFKAGSDNSQGCIGGLFSEIPPGGFGNNDYCGLSHWAWHQGDGEENTPTPTPTTDPGCQENCESTPTPGNPGSDFVTVCDNGVTTEVPREEASRYEDGKCQLPPDVPAGSGPSLFQIAIGVTALGVGLGFLGLLVLKPKKA